MLALSLLTTCLPVRRTLLPLLGCALVGCLKMPLPDYYAPLPESTSTLSKRIEHRRPTTLLLSSESGNEEGEKKSPSSLGSQFILGILPFTRLTPLQHPNQFLRELFLKLLEQRGDTVVLGSHFDLPLLQELFLPHQVIQPKFSRLSVNAYDAIVIRIVSISGEILLSSHSSAQSIPFEKKWFRPFAFAPTIAYDLHDAASDALERALPNPSHPAESLCTLPSMHLLLIAPPSIPTPLADQIGQRIRDDTGYPALPAYSAEQARRFVATSLERGAKKSKLRSATLTNQSLPRNLCNHTVWRLESTVQEVQFNHPSSNDSRRGKGGIMVALTFLVRDLRTGAPIQTRACRIEQEEGSLDAAFERAIEASLINSQGLCARL